MDDDLQGFYMLIDEYLQGACIVIVGKVVDKDDPATFRGIFILVHPTGFGHTCRHRIFENILSFLIYVTHLVGFPLKLLFCDNFWSKNGSGLPFISK